MSNLYQKKRYRSIDKFHKPYKTEKQNKHIMLQRKSACNAKSQYTIVHTLICQHNYYPHSAAQYLSSENLIWSHISKFD
jgi:hypothetical protein